VQSARLFDRDADRYDATRRGLVPCFEAFYGAALDLIDDWRGEQTLRVLDLGAGTGLFSALLLARHADAQIHVLDASDGMLERARHRFEANPAISIERGDMESARLGGPWTLVISALAIHHLDDEAKKALFGRIRSALVTGGLFVNAEQVLGPDPASEARNARVWLTQVRALGVSENEIAAAQERMAHDRCAPVENQLQWMREAGFRNVDCSFKVWRFAVMSGQA
jgi:tRNA (cmo5U34)-methyltransferase